jgi:hypothetical protein
MVALRGAFGPNSASSAQAPLGEKCAFRFHLICSPVHSTYTPHLMNTQAAAAEAEAAAAQKEAEAKVCVIVCT